jgi:hypothetical protein
MDVILTSTTANHPILPILARGIDSRYSWSTPPYSSTVSAMKRISGTSAKKHGIVFCHDQSMLTTFLRPPDHEMHLIHLNQIRTFF